MQDESILDEQSRLQVQESQVKTVAETSYAISNQRHMKLTEVRRSKEGSPPEPQEGVQTCYTFILDFWPAKL
jgi:hypothetical protein